MTFNEHPARPVLDIPQGHALGKSGLDALFPVGSRWHYGPVRENMEAVYEIIEPGAYQCPDLCDHNEPGQPKTWFIKGRVVSSPFRRVGYTTGLPPHTLIPRAVVLEERGIIEDPLADAAEGLEEALADLRAMTERYEKSCKERDRLADALRAIRALTT